MQCDFGCGRWHAYCAHDIGGRACERYVRGRQSLEILEHISSIGSSNEGWQDSIWDLAALTASFDELSQTTQAIQGFTNRF